MTSRSCKSRQRDDGSFGLWKRDKERYEYPFLTIHVAHALALAKAKGYKVPDEMINKTKPYLKNVESHFDEWYADSPQVRWTISAYALYVRDMMGDKDTAKAKRLLAEMTGGATKGGNPSSSEGALPDKDFTKAPFEALGWVLDVLANDPGSQTEVHAILHYLNNHTTETAATANFVTDYGDGAWLIMYSNRRADGVLLEALLKTVAETQAVRGCLNVEYREREHPPNRSGFRLQCDDLIPKLVRGLLDHRVKGAWSQYAGERLYPARAGQVLQRLREGHARLRIACLAREHLRRRADVQGKSIDSNVLNIPMSYLTGSRRHVKPHHRSRRCRPALLPHRHDIRAEKSKLDPADYGFTVLRKYEAVDDKDDVKQNADGSWTIKSGARVRVRLTMVAQARRYHVALVDQISRPVSRSSIPSSRRPRSSRPTTNRSPASSNTAAARTATAPGGTANTGSSTKTSATNAPRPSPPSSGRASTTTPT